MDTQLIAFSKRSDPKDLKNYVQGLDADYICSELSRICLREEGAAVLQTLFSGLSNSLSCQEKRVKISEKILNDIEKKLISPRIASKLVSVLASAVDSLTALQLVKLTETCLHMIQNKNQGDSINCWKDFLPELLNVIVKKDVEHNGTAMTGMEFKSEIVTAIYVNEWPDNMVTNMASMFVDMPLSKEEHLKIVTKLCKCLSKLKPDEIPPLTHQILQLTKAEHSMVLFLALDQYFDKRLYSKITDNVVFSQASNNDGTSLKEMHIVEGTVLYHIYTAASSLGHQSIKDFLKVLSNTWQSPEFTLRPFFITLLLSLLSVSHTFEEEIPNLLKTVISRSVAEEEKIKDSAWIESMVPSPCNVDELLDKIIHNCFRDRDKVLKGLVSLGFTLLSITKTRGKEMQCERLWNIGMTILVKLVKKYNDVTNSVLQSLAQRISQVYESTQYTDCLLRVAKKAPLNLLDCSSVLIQLLDNICARLPGDIGHRIVAAMLPLTRMSPSLRDNLIIVLRKSLFPHDRVCREMAVSGFLELLKDLKISDMTSLSQSQNYCGLSQIYSETCTGPGPSNSNEGMCLEILSILNEVFKHQHQVKIAFYNGVYDSVRANPELGSNVLKNLQSQFDKFYRPGDTVPPLDFQQTVAIQGTEAVLQEPLSHLLMSISLIVAALGDECSRGAKLREMLDSLCERMSESDIPHFGLEKEDGSSLLEPDPESLIKQEQMRQILGVYEALMGYTLCTWTKNSLEKGQIFYSLFKGFSRLSDYAKGLTKLDQKKAEEKGKGKKKDGAKDNEKKKDKVKPMAFKFSHTILGYKCCSRLLALLNEPSLDWATEQSVNPIKGKRELHRYSMQVALTLIKQSQRSPASELCQNSSTLSYICKIGRLLYTRCVKRLSEMKSFDLNTTVSALECFSELISLVLTHFRPKFSNFLNDISDVLVENGIRLQLKTIIDVLFDQVEERLEEDDEDDEKQKEEELHTRKVCCLLLSITHTLVSELPRGGNHVQKVLDRIRAICKNRKVESPNVAKGLLSLLISVYIKCKPSGGLMLDLALCLSDHMTLLDIDMATVEHTDYAVINPKTVLSCLPAVCDALKTLVNEVEWVVNRLKSELAIISLPSEETLEMKRNKLDEREREMCRHANFIVKIMNTICTTAVPPGVLSDAVLKELYNVYNKLALIAKYFIAKVGRFPQSLHATKFEKTVKLVDHELSESMYCFTEHVAAGGMDDPEQNSKRQTKKDPSALKNKLLKDTKIIPKVILEKEQFQKNILLLSNKSKIDLVGKTKFTRARDYRLRTKEMQEIIEKENIQVGDNEMDEESQCSQGELVDSPPLTKRQRTQS